MGNVAGAEQAYRRAVERGEAIGAFNLGVLLHEHGDLAGAEAAYRRADLCGQAKVGQMARAALLDLGATAGHNGGGRG
jgi:Flp pilus assembly protein TadD